MDLTVVFDFLKDLACNNNKEWFTAHKNEYMLAKYSFERFITEVITHITEYDQSVIGLRAQDCTYRIYRDLRFSPDKTPYKTYMGGYINAKGKNSNHCGYYVHIQPEGCMLAGGSFGVPPDVLKAIRTLIYDNVDEYISIVEDPAFKRFFPIVGENFIKTTPKGFPKDFEHMEYLRCREYVISYNVEDSFITSPGVFQRIDEVFIQMKRYADFINYAIDEME